MEIDFRTVIGGKLVGTARYKPYHSKIVFKNGEYFNYKNEVISVEEVKEELFQGMNKIINSYGIE